MIVIAQEQCASSTIWKAMRPRNETWKAPVLHQRATQATCSAFSRPVLDVAARKCATMVANREVTAKEPSDMAESSQILAATVS